MFYVVVSVYSFQLFFFVFFDVLRQMATYQVIWAHMKYS